MREKGEWKEKDKRGEKGKESLEKDREGYLGGKRQRRGVGRGKGKGKGKREDKKVKEKEREREWAGEKDEKREGEKG